MLISGTMRFLGVLLIDRVRDLPGVVLRGLFPGKRWLQLRYDLTPRQAFWRQFIYPLEVIWRGIQPRDACRLLRLAMITCHTVTLTLRSPSPKPMV